MFLAVNTIGTIIGGRRVPGNTVLKINKPDVYSEELASQLFGDYSAAPIATETMDPITAELDTWFASNWKQADFNSARADVLTFWSEYNRAFPTLAKFAQKILAVLATSATSERVWSLARRILSYDRASITPEHLSQLLFLKIALKEFDPKFTQAEVAAPVQ